MTPRDLPPCGRCKAPEPFGFGRRDALPPGSHKRAALDERIRQATHEMLEGRE